MDKKTLLLVPSGGLANRMRAVASAWQLCRQVGSRLQVVWFKDWALSAAFHDIFEPVDPQLLALREANWGDCLLYDRPRRRNLWLPRLPQRLIFDRIIDEQEVTPLKCAGFDFEAWARDARCYMSCYQVFGSFPASLYRELFRPVAAVMERVEANVRLLGDYAVGMHIRRTDNAEAIAKSPTRLFVEAGLREMEAHPGLRIYLATDNEDVKSELRAAFGDRIVTPSETASRDSANGIRGGLVDMWTLSRMRHIYGSAGSSFSPMAASIGDVPLTILATDGD